MLPNVAGALGRWAGPVTVKTVTKTTANFEETTVITARTVQAVVQPADMERLKNDQIDWSRKYLTVHTSEQLQRGEFIEDGGEDFKIVDAGNWQRYGYTEALAEQTKVARLVPTP